MRYRAAIPLLSIFLGLLLANLSQWPQPVLTSTAAASYGTKGPSYWLNNPAKPNTSLVRTPTGEKPQSKLWFNDGFWWADLFNNVAGNYHIYRLNLLNQTWIDTGTVLDTRAQTKADCLWDGTHLYVVSGGGGPANPLGNSTGADLPAKLFRYSYNSTLKQYTLDPQFPVTVREGGAETVVLDKDSTGRLWITYTQNSKVYVNHSLTSDLDWHAANRQAGETDGAIVIPAPSTATSLSPDDISTLIAFDGKIGVLWSNESPGQFSNSTDSAFYFAYHVDGASDTAWATATIYRQPNIADDHLNIKSLQFDPSGNLFAMVKTSLNSGASPQLLLLVAKKSGSSYAWSSYVESTHNDNQTRPLLLINTSQRMLYVFTSTEGGGDVFYKATSMDNPDFSNQPGRGTLFMTVSGYSLNNVTSTKQTVNTTSGIVILASHDNDTGGSDTIAADYYFHNYIDLNTTGPTVTPNPLTPTITPIPPTRTPSPTATPVIGPRNLDRFVYLPLLVR